MVDFRPLLTILETEHKNTLSLLDFNDDMFEKLKGKIHKANQDGLTTN